MYKLSDVCDDYGIKIKGLIDSDYYGNTDAVCDIPLIDSFEVFDDVDKLNYYKSNFNFFNAVNWSPEKIKYAINNTTKRYKCIDLIENHQLSCISLVDRTARVSKHSTLGRNVYIDGHVMVEPKSTIHDYTNIYYNTCIGHDNNVGKNCVIQRQCVIMGGNVVGNNSYFGMCVKALKYGAKFGAGTFVHEGIYIRRGTQENEIVSMESINQSRLIWQYVD
jgi:NDP-sugar pyrophosphorylase family protein